MDEVLMVVFFLVVLSIYTLIIVIVHWWYTRPNRHIIAKKTIAEVNVGLSQSLLLQEVRRKGVIDNELSLVLGVFQSDGGGGWYDEVTRILTTDPIKFSQIIDKLLSEINNYQKKKEVTSE